MSENTIKIHDVKRLQPISKNDSGMLTIEGRITTPRKMLAAHLYWSGRSETLPETAEIMSGAGRRGDHDCTIFIDHAVLGGLFLAERWKTSLTG